jgi:hypothetical protein
MKSPFKHLSFAVAVILLAAAAPTWAQFSGVDTLYASGAISFSYRQTPFPIYSGSFSAQGESLNPDGSWDPGQTQAVGGGSGVVNVDSVMTAMYGLVANANGTFDFALAAVRTLGPLHPGSYPVDINTGTSMFLFVDDASYVDLPDTLDADVVIQWFMDLPAAHKLVSIAGNINVAAVDAYQLTGTFSGTTVDIDNVFFVVSVSSGSFNLAGDPLLATPVAPASGPVVTAQPNPFNPQTTLTFSLPTAQPVAAAVFDVSGRRVRTLTGGWLDAGPVALAWNGQDDHDRPAPAGVYLFRVTGAGWSQAGKVVLMP